MKTTIGVSGKFKISVMRDGIEHYSTNFQNLILDRFLTRWADGSLTNTVQCLVGTGTAAPLVTDTTLAFSVGTPKTGTSSVVTNYKIGSDYFASTRYTFTYSVGEIVSTIGEVGVSFGTIMGGLVDTKTQIKDPAGAPTTITLTAADQLIIEYYLIQKIPTAAAPVVITVNGTPVTCTVEPMSVLNSSAWPIWTAISGLYYPNAFLYTGESLHNNPETAKLTAGGLQVTLSGITSATAGANAREVSYPVTFAQGNIVGGSFNYIAFTQTVSGADIPVIGILLDPAVSKNVDISLVIKLQFAVSRM